MGIIPEVTCRRCHRKYSGLRLRCPHCKTRKTPPSERTPSSAASAKPGNPANARANENARWQMIFGVILLAAVILAVIVLILLSIGNEAPPETSPPPTLPAESTPVPTPSPSPTPEIYMLEIQYGGAKKPEFSAHIGDNVQLTAVYYPLEADAEVIWTSSDTSVCTVSDGLVTAVGSGKCYIYAEAGGIKVDCYVIVW